MNTGYLIYQAERRPASAAEQRAIDAGAGALAASLARPLRSLAARLRNRPGTGLALRPTVAGRA